MWTWLHKYSSPKHGYQFALTMQPWLLTLSLLCLSAGLVLGLWFAPSDYQQGDVYRIMFIHVPAAILSLSIYLLMSLSALIFFIWKIKLADMVAKVCAPLGATFTVITLITGSLWGKPTWGAYWIWDARLTSELLLLFIYLGVIAIRQSIPNHALSARAGGLLTIVGVINLPIVHYSVTWWNTLHQGPTLLKFAKPDLVPSMLAPLLLMLLGYGLLFGYLLLLRLRGEIIVREKQSRWVAKLIEEF